MSSRDASAELSQSTGSDDSALRHETPTERLDRNWTDLIQEVRVVQTGVQFLTGFLLTLPFQQRFDTLGDNEIALYLGTLCASIAATAFLQAPVSVHRMLFRRHRRYETVILAHRLSIIGIFFLAVAVLGVATLIFDVVVGARAAAIAGAVTFAILVTLWPSSRGSRANEPTSSSDARGSCWLHETVGSSRSPSVLQ